MKRKNNLLIVVGALILSFLNEKYLRFMADYYVDNFHKSEPPTFLPSGGMQILEVPTFLPGGGILDIYDSFFKDTFLSFIFFQTAFFMFIFIILRHFLKLKKNNLQMFIFSISASVISYITVSPQHLYDIVNNVLEIPEFLYDPLLFIVIVHFIFVSSLFYFFVTKNNNK